MAWTRDYKLSGKDRIGNIEDGVDLATNGGSIASLAATVVKTGPYTAVAGDLVPVSTAGGAVTVTLPTAPADRSAVAVKLVAQTISGGTANAVTVACGGSDVLDKTAGATSVTFSRLNQTLVFVYNASGAIWYVMSGGEDIPTLINLLSAATYGTGISLGNVAGSFGNSGTGTPAEAYAPLTIYQKFGTNDGANAAVTKTTQAFFAYAQYFGPTSDDSAESGSATVLIKDTGVGFTQSKQTTGFEGDAQVEGSNHATGYVNGIAGRVSAVQTATIDEAHTVYAGLLTKAAGATITNHMAFFENPNNAGVATNSWTLYGPNDLHVGGFEGNGDYYADISEAAAFGLQTWNYDPGLVAANSAPTAGVVYALAVPYRKGQVVTNTVWYTNVAGAGTVPTSIVTGICDSTGKIVAQSAEQKNNSGWTGANHFVTTSLSAPYTIPASGLYYHVFLTVGAWGTTQVTLNRATSPTGFPNGSLAAATGATTGQTALPANGSTLAGGLTSTSALRFFAASN